jgi:hypothetical protein
LPRRDILKHQIELAKRKAGTVQGKNAIDQAFADVDGLLGELKDMETPVRLKLIVDDVTPEAVKSMLPPLVRFSVPEVTLSDPAAYTRPWTVAVRAELAADTEMIEWVCNESSHGVEHWVGKASDERKGEVPVAFVVSRSGAPEDPDGLVAFCRDRLASFKVPREVRFVASLPRTALGKVEKRRLY